MKKKDFNSRFASTINQDFIPYRKNNRWGYCNTKGEILIEPKYSFVNFFEEGLAIVGKYVEVGVDDIEVRHGLINQKGEEILPLVFSEIIRSSFGGVIVKGFRNKHDEVLNYKCFDVNGKEYNMLEDLLSRFISINPELAEEYRSIYQISEQLFIGVKVINPKYNSRELILLNEFGQKIELNHIGLIIKKEALLQMGFWIGAKGKLKINGKDGLIDEYGVVIIPFIYDSLFSFETNLAIAVKAGKSGIIDLHNNVIVEFIYDELQRFQKEKIIWRGRIGEDYTYFSIIDGQVEFSGNIYPELEPDYIRINSINLVYDEEEENVELYNNEGIKIIDKVFSYKEEPEIFGELAKISKGDRFTIIDKFGREIIESGFDDIEHLGSGNFYCYNYDEKPEPRIINSKGELIYLVDRKYNETKFFFDKAESWTCSPISIDFGRFRLLQVSLRIRDKEYIYGFITNQGIECWSGEMKYKDLDNQFFEFSLHEDDEGLDFQTNDDFLYVEGPTCPACGGREYMCCNYWIEKNS